MNDIFTQRLRLPLSVRGLVVPAPDGDYQIILNSAYSAEQQSETYRHEMRHILLGHYQQQGRPLAGLEAEANDQALLLEKISYAARHGLPPATLFTRARPIHVSVCAPPGAPIVLSAAHHPAAFIPAAAALHSIRRAHLTGMLTPHAFSG